MMGRRADLRGSMGAASAQEAGQLVSVMFAGFQSVRDSEDEAKKRLALYVSQLKAFPAWAIKASCERFMRGEVGGANAAFAPSIAELVSDIVTQTRWIRAELADLDAVLDADVMHEPDEAEQERMRIKWRQLADEIGLAADPTAKREREPTRQEALEWLHEAQEAAPMSPPPAMSEESRAKMGLIGRQSKSEAA